MSVVYFIGCKGSDNVKIGTTNNLDNRIRDLQISNATELYVIATMPGGQEKERKIHKLYEQYRIRGEWFRLPRRIIEEIHLQPEVTSYKPLSLKQAMEAFKRDYINRILASNGGNRTKTAKDLGVNPRTIFRHIEEESRATCK